MLQRSLITLAALVVAPAFLRGSQRRPHGYGRELQQYREQLAAATARIDDVLGAAAETVEGLRHRGVDPEEAVVLLQRLFQMHLLQTREILLPTDDPMH